MILLHSICTKVSVYETKLGTVPNNRPHTVKLVDFTRRFMLVVDVYMMHGVGAVVMWCIFDYMGNPETAWQRGRKS